MKQWLEQKFLHCEPATLSHMLCKAFLLRISCKSQLSRRLFVYVKKRESTQWSESIQSVSLEYSSQIWILSTYDKAIFCTPDAQRYWKNIVGHPSVQKSWRQILEKCSLSALNWNDLGCKLMTLESDGKTWPHQGPVSSEYQRQSTFLRICPWRLSAIEQTWPRWRRKGGFTL